MENNFLTVIKKTSDILLKNNLKLSIAESCTGGFISNVITNFPGSSKFYEMSVICYSKRSKIALLGIRPSIIKKYGMVSEETAVAMAKSVLKLGKNDISLSITGIAGPERIEDKEIGLIFMAVVYKQYIEFKGMKLTGNREFIKKQASLEALHFLYQVLNIWT